MSKQPKPISEPSSPPKPLSLETQVLVDAIAAAMRPAPKAARPEPLRETFRKRLREHLQKRGWTQRDLAERLKVDQSRISHIFSGYRENVRLDTIEDIARVLGIEPAELLLRQSLFR